LADWWWPRGYRTYQVSWWTWSFPAVPFRAPWRVHKAQCRCCVCIPAQESCPQWPCFVNDWYSQASSWYGLQESNPLASSTWRLYQGRWCPTWLANETTWEGMSTKSKMWQMSVIVWSYGTSLFSFFARLSSHDFLLFQRYMCPSKQCCQIAISNWTNRYCCVQYFVKLHQHFLVA
jgi:hypothetical protein